MRIEKSHRRRIGGKARERVMNLLAIGEAYDHARERKKP